ncbi:FecR family protein [Methylophilus aquaticus]|uniref:FecR domain-containing protein n=1 Tax=Methylophilus aquaticus TaxID=1971610 RepID=A0ABT9JVQ4_9PROT|nr:FecR domain-containing protein [Methylophilus aquaticus]MDP8568678.1 FecR domain-containing protein [Methylophilus aquaticus]
MPAPNKISETAARWFIRMQEAPVDAPERSQFEAWLMQSPLHQQEYLSISEAWRGLDSLDELQTLATARKADRFFKQSERKKARQKLAGTVASVVAAICIGWASYHQYQAWQATPTMQLVAHTSTAQLTTQTLDDGSRVTLNANSRIEIKYYRNQRHIDLLQGEAVFEVQPDRSRPFVVETQRLKVTVLGTRFAVNKLKQLERVSVDHGKVQVLNKQGQQALILQNNQVAEINQHGLQTRPQVNAQDYFRFMTGTLVFNQASLSEIAETVSRYQQKPITNDDRSEEKISAVVAIKDSNSFIATLPRIANVRVHRSPEGIQLETYTQAK